MRKLLIAAALSCGLAGCATTSGTPSIDVGQVQQAAIAACGFLPTVETVVGIIATFATGGAAAPVVATAEGVAEAICSAVVPKAAARRGGAPAAPPAVNGVVIHGQFVR